jgi:hypothetical protein
MTRCKDKKGGWCRSGDSTSTRARAINDRHLAREQSMRTRSALTADRDRRCNM